MAKVDWERFCNSQHIEYVKTNASLARGYINIHCPFCGDADTGSHLGLHTSGRWSCYRDSLNHKGQDPRRIIMHLIGCTYEQADTYIQEDVIDLSDFDAAASQFVMDDKTVEQRSIELLDEFRPLISIKGRAKMYWNYVLSRGFKPINMPTLVRRYDLHYCDKGRWGGRIIIPIRIDDKLVSWTGRTVYKSEDLRYLTLSHREPKDDDPLALVNVKDILFNYDNAMRKHRRVCVLVEGPLDAIKVDYLGYNHGITAVSTLGTGIRDAQLDMLESLRRNCDRLVTCGDRNAESNVMSLLSAASDFKLQNIQLPEEIGDPAELNRSKILNLFSNI